MTVQTCLETITPLDRSAMELAIARQAALAKPPGSLGRLEALSVQLAGITGRVHNEVRKKHLLVFAADNGVVAEGVSSAPQSVTRLQATNLTHARTGASVLCREFGCELTVCDIGIRGMVAEPRILSRKIAHGTGNILHEPAMTREETERAILTGIELAMETEADVLGVGEMGIGNTTTSSAVLAALLGRSAVEVTGRGGGLTDESFHRKVEVIQQALDRHRPDPGDVMGVLSCLGGLDIAAMCGAFLGAAASRRPVVIDGFISAVAALCASRLCPDVMGYLVPSHASCEGGYAMAMDAMGLKPMLLLDMRLGEGSGCPLAFLLLEAACSIMNHMATFAEAGIDDSYLVDVREEMQ